VPDVVAPRCNTKCSAEDTKTPDRAQCSQESQVRQIEAGLVRIETDNAPTASQELVSQFNELLGSDRHFGLLATISSEQLQPLQLLTPASSSNSFASNVESLLQPHIKPNEALYIILRKYSSAPALVAVTYVPDTAKVRQKMLFASTRLTLVRELGSEHFRDTFFATTADELSPAGFEKHEAHSALEAPLTEEERSLGEVRRAEQEAGMGTGARAIHLSKNLDTPIADEALQALKDLGADSRSLVMLVCASTLT
jgi:twinfilin-like protein